jgi:hypothetical protein
MPSTPPHLSPPSSARPQELNIKPKNWRDLITDDAFTRKDIITIQDPQNMRARAIAEFDHVQKVGSLGGRGAACMPQPSTPRAMDQFGREPPSAHADTPHCYVSTAAPAFRAAATLMYTHYGHPLGSRHSALTAASPLPTPHPPSPSLRTSTSTTSQRRRAAACATPLRTCSVPWGRSAPARPRTPLRWVGCGGRRARAGAAGAEREGWGVAGNSGICPVSGLSILWAVHCLGCPFSGLSMPR